MNYGSDWDQDASYINRLISYRARNLAGTSGFSESDVEDIQQELVLDLQRRLPKFDAGRASRRTFITRVLDNRIRTLAKDQEAQKRDYRKLAHSLDEEIELADGTVTSRRDLLSSDEVECRKDGKSLPSEERMNLAADIRRFRQRLLPEHQRICSLFMEGETATSVAEILGISRSTVYERRSQIRELLEGSGIENYLTPSSDTSPLSPVCSTRSTARRAALN